MAIDWLTRFKNAFRSSAYSEEAPPKGYPPTAIPPAGEDLQASQLVFDPALKQFPHAFRTQPDHDMTPAQTQAFRQTQGAHMSHVLQQIATSDLAQHLALRGSAAMPFWAGESARTPKDLDFVVLPHTAKIDGLLADQIFSQLPALIQAADCPGLVSAGPPLISQIWTYDRVPGRRIVFRYKTQQGHWGSTQLDLVFGEKLLTPPISVDGLDIGVCGPVISLAWKLCWLASDFHPQAKDLYDAVVLAELLSLTKTDMDLIRTVIAANPDAAGLRWEQFAHPDVEWVGFQQTEESQRFALAEAWFERLNQALPDWASLAGTRP